MDVLKRCAFAALGFVLLAVSAAYDAPYLHAQTLVDVGGRHINLYCTGSGSPTVVLDTDGDDTIAMWRFVQPAVSAKTRVCSYDTPGFGFSDPLKASERADADANATILHTVLQRAGVRGPVVLVGNAVSGLYDRVYADRYKGDVAALVLVSPNIPFQNQHFARVAPAIAAQMSVDGFLKHCLSAAEHGQISPGKAAYTSCEYTPPDPTISANLLRFIHKQWQSVELWRSFANAGSDETSLRSSKEVVAEQRSYGTMPLIVLTTTKDVQSLPIPPKQKAALLTSWVAWHRAIAELSKNGADRIVAGSTSSIQIDRPQAVVSAIDDVMQQLAR